MTSGSGKPQLSTNELLELWEDPDNPRLADRWQVLLRDEASQRAMARLLGIEDALIRQAWERAIAKSEAEHLPAIPEQQMARLLSGVPLERPRSRPKRKPEWARGAVALAATLLLSLGAWQLGRMRDRSTDKPVEETPGVRGGGESPTSAEIPIALFVGERGREADRVALVERGPQRWTARLPARGQLQIDVSAPEGLVSDVPWRARLELWRRTQRGERTRIGAPQEQTAASWEQTVSFPPIRLEALPEEPGEAPGDVLEIEVLRNEQRLQVDISVSGR